jgi:hypothetical protein
LPPVVSDADAREQICTRCLRKNIGERNACLVCGGDLVPIYVEQGPRAIGPGFYCSWCGDALEEGARFCQSCGNVVGGTAEHAAPLTRPQPAAAPMAVTGPRGRGFVANLRTFVAIVGLLVAASSVFFPWSIGQGRDFHPLDEGVRYRLGDFRAQDNLDGYTVLALAGVALVFTLAATRGGWIGGIAARIGGIASGLLIPLAIVELQFVTTQFGFAVGNGLWVLIGGAAVTSVMGMFRRMR